MGAPAGRDVEPLDPHRRRGVRVRRGKTVAIAIAVCGGDVVVVGAAVVVEVVVKNRREVEVGGGVVALVEQEVGVVDERVVRARRRRAAEQRPAPLPLLLRLVVDLPRFALPFSLLSAVAAGGGVEEEGWGAEDEVGAAWLGVHPARPGRAQHHRRLRLPAAPGGRGRGRRLDEHPPHGSRRHALSLSSKICSSYLLRKSDSLQLWLNIASDAPACVGVHWE